MREMSKNNPCYISMHKKQELKHFCLQYREWKQALNDISFFASVPKVKIDTGVTSTVENLTEKRDYYLERIGLIETCAKEANPDIWKWIMLGATEDKNYTALRNVYNIPCHQGTYYASLQRFYYILGKYR